MLSCEMEPLYSLKMKIYIIVTCMLIAFSGCVNKITLKHYAYKQVNYLGKIHSRKEGVLTNDIKCYKNSKKFCLNTYTLHYKTVDLTYLFYIKGRDKWLIQSNSDSAFQLKQFRLYSQNMEMPDSVSKAFEAAIIQIVKTNPR